MPASPIVKVTLKRGLEKPVLASPITIKLQFFIFSPFSPLLRQSRLPQGDFGDYGGDDYGGDDYGGDFDGGDFGGGDMDFGGDF